MTHQHRNRKASPLAKRTVAVVGAESLLGRELRELADRYAPSADLRLIGAETEEGRGITASEDEAVLLAKLDAEALACVNLVFLAGPPESSRKALDALAGSTATVIDVAGFESAAPLSAPQAGFRPEGGRSRIAHPAAIALALFFARLGETGARVEQSVVSVFEPASERGKAGLSELEKQSINLLSFRPLPKAVFDTQAGFTLLPEYGEDAPTTLRAAEERLAADAATLTGMAFPLRLVQAPVFHGHSILAWVRFATPPGSFESLAGDLVDFRGEGVEVPTNTGVTGESGITVGSVRIDRADPRAAWFWIVSDNLRLAAENAWRAAQEALA